MSLGSRGQERLFAYEGASFMIPRYSRPEMAALFSEEARFARWLEVEIAACEANRLKTSTLCAVNTPVSHLCSTYKTPSNSFRLSMGMHKMDSGCFSLM